MAEALMQIGLQNCVANPPAGIRKARLGLLANHASVDPEFQSACDLIEREWPDQLQVIFSPQHGFWGEEQANMIESAHGRFRLANGRQIPLFSLYSETRTPTPQMLRQIDTLIVDLQDVGTRVYTFVWTLLKCLKASAAAGIQVVVLDRPNPLGGVTVEGPCLHSGFESFVGGASIPLRHHLTIGEMALFLNGEQNVGADLQVVPMSGWHRRMHFADTGLPWVAPSPNMPSPVTSLLYPGQVLLEGVNLSEGRGTTTPFEVVGAPFLNGLQLLQDISLHHHPGVVLRRVRFRPMFDKWCHESCEGVAIQIVDPRAVRSVALTVSILSAAIQQAPNDVAWLKPPYEYEQRLMPIDILWGSSQLRARLNDQPSLSQAELDQLCSPDSTDWHQRTEPYLLYAQRNYVQ